MNIRKITLILCCIILFFAGWISRKIFWKSSINHNLQNKFDELNEEVLLLHDSINTLYFDNILVKYIEPIVVTTYNKKTKSYNKEVFLTLRDVHEKLLLTLCELDPQTFQCVSEDSVIVHDEQVAFSKFMINNLNNNIQLEGYVGFFIGDKHLKAFGFSEKHNNWWCHN